MAVRCDHTRDEEAEALIARIHDEQGRLDILVNNIWGGNELPIENEPFWALPLAIGRTCLPPECGHSW